MAEIRPAPVQTIAHKIKSLTGHFNNCAAVTKYIRAPNETFPDKISVHFLFFYPSRFGGYFIFFLFSYLSIFLTDPPPPPHHVVQGKAAPLCSSVGAHTPLFTQGSLTDVPPTHTLRALSPFGLRWRYSNFNIMKPRASGKERTYLNFHCFLSPRFMVFIRLYFPLIFKQQQL